MPVRRRPRHRAVTYFVVTHVKFDDDYKHRGDAADVDDVKLCHSRAEADAYVRERQYDCIRRFLMEYLDGVDDNDRSHDEELDDYWRVFDVDGVQCREIDEEKLEANFGALLERAQEGHYVWRTSKWDIHEVMPSSF